MRNLIRYIPIFGIGMVIGILNKYMESFWDTLVLAIGLGLSIGPLLKKDK